MRPRKPDTSTLGASESLQLSERRLTTLNHDVQHQIISFLSTPDASRLGRTCRYLLAATVPLLCSRSDAQALRDGNQIASFHAFLRINSGPLSRDTFVNGLWFDLPHSSFYYDTRKGLLSEHSDAFLDILRYCRKLQRLRIDGWFKTISPDILIHVISTSLLSLGELRFSSPTNPHVDIKTVRKLVHLPLRRLSLSVAQWENTSDLLTALRPLSSTLLDVDLSSLLKTTLEFPFAGALKAGVMMSRMHQWEEPSRDTTLIDILVSAFPNVARLNVHAERSHCCVDETDVDDASRQQHQLQWRTVYMGALQSLASVWVADLCVLYCLGFPRPLASMSTAIEGEYQKTMFTTALCDTQLSFLELRFSGRAYAQGWREGIVLIDSAPASIVRLVLIFDIGDARLGKLENISRSVFDALTHTLPRSHLTHLLVMFTDENHDLSKRDLGPISQAVSDALPLLAEAAAPSPLEWIGFEMRGWELRSWKLPNHSRPSDAGHSPAAAERAPDSLVELTESAGWRIVKEQGLDEFWDMLE